MQRFGEVVIESWYVVMYEPVHEITHCLLQFCTCYVYKIYRID